MTITIKMNRFTIFAHGKDFDIDQFLPTTALSFDCLWRIGDHQRYSSVDSKYSTNGVEIVLGDGYDIPFQKQEEIAMRYMTENRKELQALGKFSGVESFILGFHYHVKLEENLLGFTMGSSEQLMSLALDVGIVPVYYVTLERDLN